MKAKRWIGGLVLMLGLTGCGTVKQAYVPDHLGNLSDDETDQGIQIILSPDKYRARIGEPVTFKVVIRNVGTQPVLFPVDSELLLTWVYPDGRRDNLIRSDRPISSHEAILLKPGQERVEHSVVTTYYFDRAGIHEFRAIVSGDELVAQNKTAWTGRAVSNGFGVFFEAN